MSGLQVLDCVVGSELSVVAKRRSEESRLSRHRRAFVEACLTLDGRRLSAVAEADDEGLVSVVGTQCPAPRAAGRPVTNGAHWWDEEWQERAYRTLAGDLPGESERFPGGLVPLFTCPCGDPWCLYVAVKVTFAGENEVWHELRTVAYREMELPGRWGRTRTVTSWEPPTLGENVLPRAFTTTPAEIRHLLDAAAAARPEWEGGVISSARRWAEPDASPARDRGETWARAVKRVDWSLARTGDSVWDDSVAEALAAACARHDPLGFSRCGVVDESTYAGVPEDLGALMPPSGLTDDPEALLGDYFRQVWWREPHPDRLLALAREARALVATLDGWDGWLNIRIGSPKAWRARRARGGVGL